MNKKHLYLVRHAKAEEHSSLKKDFDRVLINKGIAKAQRIATELNHILPTDKSKVYIHTSAAARTLQTCEIFAQIIGIDKAQITSSKNMYLAPYRTLLKIINNIPAEVEHFILVGHNYELSDLCNYLCDSHIVLKTSETAVIELPESFSYSMVSGGTGNLLRVIQ